MKLNKLLPLIGIILGLLGGSAQAHFQLLYTPELLHDRGGEIVLKMPFTHPAESGYVMDMARPIALRLFHKGKEKDLTASLQAMDWTSATNTGKAWQATDRLRGLGDYIYVLKPVPYLEEAEGIYIQQITKTIINRGSLPSGWDKPVGLKTEILPLAQPYALFTGGLFSGVVLSEGKPVPFAEIEVAYMNFPPDMDNNAFADQGLIHYPADAFVNQSIRADANGTFSFGLPKAGHWGFVALGTGPDKAYQGKALSQDAVLWIQVTDMIPVTDSGE